MKTPDAALDAAAPASSAELETIWTFPGPGAPNPYGVSGRPLIMAGDRLIGVFERKIYAIDIYNGREIVAASGFPYACANAPGDRLTIADGALFFVDAAGEDGAEAICALELATGKPRDGWQPIPLEGVTALVAFPGLVVAILSSWGATSVSAYKTGDGSLAWPTGPFSLADGTAGAIGIGSDALFFVFQNQLYAVNTDSGCTRFPKPTPAAAPASWTLDQRVVPLVGERIVVCAGDAVYGYDRKTGVCIWTFSPQGAAPGEWSMAMSQDRKWIAAANAIGGVYALNVETGVVIAEKSLSQACTPVINGNSIILTSADNRELNLLSVDVAGNKFTLDQEFSLPAAAASLAPTIGNGSIYIPTPDGNITALGLSGAQAAYFDGTTCLAVEVNQGQPFTFNFGAGELGIEAWVHGSLGGEIVSSYPADSSAASHGFRFNIGTRGELRFAVVNADNSNRDLARTGATIANDGCWHHVAVTRAAGNAVTFYLDGMSIPLFTLNTRANVAVHRNGQGLKQGIPIRDTLTVPAPPDACDIPAQRGLTIGAYVRPGQSPEAQFNGLLREVRIWSVRLDATAVKSRMNKQLAPNEPHMWGNWHLDASDPSYNAKNDVGNNPCSGGSFSVGAGGNPAISLVTDLNIDDSAFPYILHQQNPQWPYTASWIARGEYAILTAPALSGGVMCFGTDNMLYGVNKSSGARLWSVRVALPSTPVAFAAVFYAMTDEFGLIRIDSRTGSYAEVPGIGTFEPAPGDPRIPAPAPATDGRFLAAAKRDGSVWIMDFSATPPAAREFPTAAHPADLVLESSVVYTVAGGSLFAIDPVAGASKAPVGSNYFCVFQDWVFCVQDNVLVRLDRKTLTSVTARATAVKGLDITGLAIDPDSSLLVVSTSQGSVLGFNLNLGLNWTSVIPDGHAGSPSAVAGYINPCTISGRDIFCTSRSGAVAALDGRTGSLFGFVLVPNAVLTTPLESSGALYFGCDDPSSTAPADGALHSIIFGEHYALRLGVTPLDTAGLSGFASIQSPALETFYFSNPRECSVEAWINTKLGGEVVSLRQTDKQPGLRLWLDSSIHFSLLGSPSGQTAGQTIQAQAAVSVLDGAWHHIAVTCKAAAADGLTPEIRIYLNGVSQTVTLLPNSTTGMPLSQDIFASVGSDVTQSGPSPNYFTGLIAEVRLWDTWLIAAEIGSRMHDKLLGSEPDLLAYWNFNTLGVNDGSPNALNGTLQGSATFWLTDLAFEHPDYAHLSSAGTIHANGESGLQAGDPRALTVYQLVVTAQQGDNTPYAQKPVSFWYVRHADIGEPETVTVQNGTISTVLTGVIPGQPEGPVVLSAITDRNGRITLTVSTTDLLNGPSFDLWAPFMPPNERYHVNCLLNNQTMVQPNPPTLISQSRLLQDYRWSTGGTIDSSRGRSTYRITLTTLNPDNSPRAKERLELYATGFLDVEVRGQIYSLNADNDQPFDTDAEGELTLLVEASHIKSVSLSIWAGYMNPQVRYTVNPAEDAHGTLGSVQGTAITETRMTEWRSVAEGGPQSGALLSAADHQNADTIAGAVRHVMSAAPGSSVPPASLKSAAPRLLGAPPPVARPTPPSVTAQRTPMPRADITRSLLTMKHINRLTPLTPEASLASIQRVSPGSVGFSFEASGSGTLKFAYLNGAEAAALVSGSPLTPMPHLHVMGVFNIFSDLWSDIEEAADDLYAAAQKLVVTITNAINIAIHSATGILHMVVHSIEEAADAVAGFFVQLALKIEELVKFLTMLFDFEAIIKTHNLIGDTFRKFGPFLEGVIGDGSKIDAAFLGMTNIVTGQLGFSASSSAASVTTLQQQHASGSNPAVAGSSSVGARSMYTKMKDNQGGMTIARANPVASAADEIGTDSADFIQGLLTLIPSIATSNPADLGTQLLALLEKQKTTPGDPSIGTALATFGGALDGMVELLDYPIEIPFISALYKWICGRDLSVLDLFSLVLAVPVHVVYLLLTGNKFCDDAAGMTDAFAAAKPLQAVAFASASVSSGSGPSAPADSYDYTNPLKGYARPDDLWAQYMCIVFSCFSFAGKSFADRFFVEMAASGDVTAPNKALGLARVVQGMAGLFSSSFLFLYSTPAFLGDVLTELENAHMDPGFSEPAEVGARFTIQQYYAYKAITVFAASLVSNGNTLKSGVKGLLGEPSASGSWPLVKFGVMLLKSVYIIVAIVADCYDIKFQKEYGSHVDSDLGTGAYCFFARDMMNKIVDLPDFMFTVTGAKIGSNWVLDSLANVRFVAGGLGVMCHAAGELGPMNSYRSKPHKVS